MISIARSFCKVLAGVIVLGLLCSCTNQLFVDSEEVTQGKVGDIEIGMSKQQVLDVARREKAHAIRPILPPASVAIDYSDVADLVPPRSGRALELFDGERLSVVYAFQRCKVAGMRSRGSAAAPSAIAVGDSAEDAVEKLKATLQKDHALSVREVINSANGAWFLIDASADEMASILAYDVWSFEVPAVKPAGARFVIYFSDERVVRITYSRPRMRVE